MALVRLFTSFHGRISRSKAFIGLTILAALATSATVAAALAGGIDLNNENPKFRIVIFAVQLVFVYPWTALMVKRWQDRNRPGWYAAFILVPFMLKAITDVFGITGDQQTMNWLDYVFNTIIFVVALWFFIELGILRGTIGSNPHGPDPLSGTPKADKPPVTRATGAA
jgi:uncharacterized membrane protein YhaH (DUF805 family)